uniref:Fe2OG dioxygenase domain-containing protein n=1 Tax=Lotharella oceanica TaxID=641309 RepID=A0A7S2X5P1_9EUKA|mmetsp:Transcript_1026/g.1911  ORF Transcript_1026/g.1911 Transcript_1026/m.1911 type:complete len:153 (+) Transcript_1026:444-902(+)
MRPLLERFCNCKLQERAKVYGVRIYHKGAHLIEHLDWCDTWVISATICVGRSPNGTSAGWPLVVRKSLLPGIGGEMHQVVQEAGEAVLYEGSRLYHGRPESLRGDSYMGLFLGFTPEAYPASARWPTQILVTAIRRLRETIMRVLRASKAFV